MKSYIFHGGFTFQSNLQDPEDKFCELDGGRQLTPVSTRGGYDTAAHEDGRVVSNRKRLWDPQ